MISFRILIESLEELANRELQEELWIHGDIHRMSSFEEASCGAFDDGGLTRAIESGFLGQNYSAELDATARALSAKIDSIPDRVAPEEVIDHPRMEEVRLLAGQLSRLLEKETNDEQ